MIIGRNQWLSLLSKSISENISFKTDSYRTSCCSLMLIILVVFQAFIWDKSALKNGDIYLLTIKTYTLDQFPVLYWCAAFAKMMSRLKYESHPYAFKCSGICSASQSFSSLSIWITRWSTVETNKMFLKMHFGIKFCHLDLKCLISHVII